MVNPEQSPQQHRPFAIGAMRWKARWFALPAILILVVFAGRHCGSCLVVNNPQKSDAILVLAGGRQQRYERAMQLLQDGYGDYIIADVPVIRYFGHPASELAKEYFGS